MKNIGFAVLIFLLLTNCGMNMGHRIDAENLSVYFLEEVPREKAIEFAKYWRDNDFVGERKQVIQLEKEKNSILVKIIERESYHVDEITITEEAMLQDLERLLAKEIFQMETIIVITDNTFRPILKRKNS